MISRVSIRNFQSLKKVDLELGPFTVIVGNSATGKSAFIRALKAAASNVRGSSLMTAGESALSVSVESQAWKITLEKGLSTNSYYICDLATGAEQEYTKLAGDVPKAVTDLLGVDPLVEGRSVNFAGERDQPYLLDESGQHVAKALGDLTNVSTILEAVREANRRRNGYSASVKVLKNDLDRLRSKLSMFSSLSQKRGLLESLTTAVVEAEELSSQISKLSAVIDSVERVGQLSQRSLPELPDVELVESTFLYMQNLINIAKKVTSAQTRIAELEKLLNDSLTLLDNFTKDYDAVLLELGNCPTCHQKIKSGHAHLK